LVVVVISRLLVMMPAKGQAAPPLAGA
jgi:hypothetical protein